MGKRTIIVNKGDIFERLTVLGEKSEGKNRYIICQCICGKIRNVFPHALKSGKTKSCGCLTRDRISKPRVQLKEKYNRLTIIKELDRLNKKDRRVLCQCDCGNHLETNLESVKQGNTKSCGCIRKEKPNGLIHGLTGTTEYVAWRSMKGRCYNMNDKRNFKDYGGRGIKVCDRWLEPKGQGFLNFLSDMGKRPEGKYSLDRINVNGNYEPSNCRWADDKIQNNNKRVPVYTMHRGRLSTPIPVGSKFNKLTVVEELEKVERRRFFNTQCVCGNYKKVSYGNLTTGNVKSCGCHRREHRLSNIQIGERYGRLTITKVHENDMTIPTKKRRRMVDVLCDCGNTKTLRHHDLKMGKTKSCGCFTIDWFISKDITYQLNYRRLYERHYKVKIGKGNHIHHIDGNRENNNPYNLLEVSQEEHTWIHTKPELIGVSRDYLIEILNDWFRCVVA
jgi:hypothetical protein